MKAWFTILLLVGSLFTLPLAMAHACGGGSDCVCPAPNDGQQHSHASGGKSCASDGSGASAYAGGGEASATPGLGLVAALGAIAVVALLARRA